LKLEDEIVTLAGTVPSVVSLLVVPTVTSDAGVVFVISHMLVEADGYAPDNRPEDVPSGLPEKLQGWIKWLASLSQERITIVGSATVEL